MKLVLNIHETGTNPWHQRGTSPYEKAEKHAD
jgi:hypothetical protein